MKRSWQFIPLCALAIVAAQAGMRRIAAAGRKTAQAGTPLMQCAQLAGIDLPMKALVWTDAAGQTWLGYNDPQWLMHRHGQRDCAAAEPVGKALAGIAAAVVAK